jgi:hypothetical protein
MKKFTILTLLILMASWLSLQAQTEKNKLWVAGGFRIELNQGGENDKTADYEDKYSYMDVDFQPKIGYTVIDNMPIGLFMDCDFYREKAKDDDDKYMERAFTIGPFIRYYFADVVGLKPYCEAMVGFGVDRGGYKSEDMDEWNLYYKEGYITFRIGGGLTYFFNDYIGADLFLGFNHYAYTDKNEDEGNRSDWDYKDVYNEFLMQVGVVVMLPLK